MKDFREISIANIMDELESGNNVFAVVLNADDRIVKGGDFVKRGVYELNNRMSIADISFYKKEDNVAFYAQKKDEAI